MKRVYATLVATLICAAPAWGGTYWVSPVGHYDNDGGDSTKYRAKTLAWANQNATAGDTIYLKSSFGAETDTCCGTPQYNVPIRPTHSGTDDTHRIWFIGDINNPGSRKVTYVRLDSTAGCAGYVSVYGVRAERPIPGSVPDTIGALEIKSPHGGARHDSVAYCTINGNTSLSQASNVTITNCRIGDGMLRGGRFPTLHLEGHGSGTLAINWVFSDSLVFTNNYCDVAMGQQQGNSGNVVTFRTLKNPIIANNYFRQRLYNLRDTSLLTTYYCQGMYIHDNTFEGWAQTSDGLEMYLVNVRDGQIGNRWIDNRFIENPDSPVPLKFFFMTAGNAEPTYDPGSRNTRWNGNFIRVRGDVGWQSASHGDTVQFNTLVVEKPVWLSNPSDPNDSLFFNHNTIVSFSPSGGTLRGTDSLRNNKLGRLTKNYVLSMRPSYNYVNGVGFFGARGTAVADSNLYGSMRAGDSTRAVAYGLWGGSAPTSIAAVCADTKIVQECNSRWVGNLAGAGISPFADTLWATFDSYPSTSSIAISSDLWGSDGYVGAKGPTADATPPTVAINAPEDGLNCPLGVPVSISWTASDDVGVARIDIDRGVVGAGGAVTWYTIKHDIAGDETEWFWVPANTRYTHTQIRVTAYDAAGNYASDTVEVVQPCVGCRDDDPYYEVP